LNDTVLDMFLKPCKVTKKIVITNCTSYNVTLSNSTGSFYVHKDQPIRNVISNTAGNILNWDSISNAYNNNAELKSSGLIVRTGNPIHILNFNADTTSRTLYNLVVDNTVKTFFINNVVFQSALNQ
jgi:hypothetical protein